MLYATLFRRLELNHCETAKLLERDLYVDNVLSNVEDEAEAIKYFTDARSIMKTGGFNPRSWTSNNAKVCELATAENVLDIDKYTKISGMFWNSQSDEVRYP